MSAPTTMKQEAAAIVINAFVQSVASGIVCVSTLAQALEEAHAASDVLRMRALEDRLQALNEENLRLRADLAELSAENEALRLGVDDGSV